MRARLRRFKGGQRFRDPRSLFMGNAQGFWLDFTDMSTMFQDTAGTVPVTVLGDPVALVRDKSGNGYGANRALDALVIGAELAVPNKITAVVDVDGQQAIAIMGLTPIPSEDE